MKKVYFAFLAAAILLCMTACGTHPSAVNAGGNSSAAQIEKIDVEGCLPVTVNSLEAVLAASGRFTIEEVEQPQSDGRTSVAVYGWLDKDGDHWSAGTYFCETDTDNNATGIVSYNFLKSDVTGEREKDIQWGLSILLHAFGVDLTDDMWEEIMIIARNDSPSEALGTDYDGYSDELAGIRLIYADLSESVQIDIRTYGQE